MVQRASCFKPKKHHLANKGKDGRDTTPTTARLQPSAQPAAFARTHTQLEWPSTMQTQGRGTQGTRERRTHAEHHHTDPTLSLQF